MISSAKLTAVSLVAAAALGAAVFGGCTVTSTTDTDTDGGSTSGGTSGRDDSGTDASTNACPSNTKQKNALNSAACQACLDTSCCAELTACFNIDSDDAGTNTEGCNGYAACVETCDPGDDSCLEDVCDATAKEGVKEAFGAIEQCAASKCATACGVEQPDGG